MVARRTAFTLIELLVVIAIIALLVSILMPSLSKAKELAMRAKCSVQMRSVSNGSLLYSEDYANVLPTKMGTGVRYELAGTRYSVRELYFQGYVTEPMNFRCPALKGNSDWWNNDPLRSLKMGYLGYQYFGMSTFITQYSWASAPWGTYFIQPEKINPPSDYILLGCNIINDVAAQGYHNYMEFNWTCHTQQEPKGAPMAYLDSSVRWLPYTAQVGDGTVTASTTANFVGPYWETMLPARALIVKDDACYPSGGIADRYFWSNGHNRTPNSTSSRPLRGKLEWSSNSPFQSY